MGGCMGGGREGGKEGWMDGWFILKCSNTVLRTMRKIDQKSIFVSWQLFLLEDRLATSEGVTMLSQSAGCNGRNSPSN